MYSIEQLSEITRRIVQTSQPDKIILFGSYARGDFQEGSDLDVLVVVPNVKDLRQESLRIRRALRGLLAAVDIVVATPEQMERLGNTPGTIYQSALEEGKVVYERGEGCAWFINLKRSRDMISSLFLVDKRSIFWINQYFCLSFFQKCAGYSGLSLRLAPAYAETLCSAGGQVGRVVCWRR